MDLDARDDLILRHRKLVTTLATDFAVSASAAHIEWDDVLAAGLLGLVYAADRWKPERGRFSAFCRRYVRREIRRTLHILRPLLTGLELSWVPDHRISRVPSLEPLFPIMSYVPASACPHRGPMRSFAFVCGVCWQCAYDRHPDMQLTARDLNSRRRPRRIAAEIPIPKLAETRRQRRLRLYPVAAAV